MDLPPILGDGYINADLVGCMDLPPILGDGDINADLVGWTCPGQTHAASMCRINRTTPHINIRMCIPHVSYSQVANDLISNLWPVYILLQKHWVRTS